MSTVSEPPAVAGQNVEILRPERQSVPLVFTSPHSGRDYPKGFVAASALDPVALRRSEDSFVDELFAAAQAAHEAVDGDRVSTFLKIDDKRDRDQRAHEKVDAVEEALGREAKRDR